MTTLHAALANHVRAVVFDLDGVLYEDARPVAGAAEVVNRLSAVMPVRFLTNTTSKNRRLIVEKLTSFGFQASTEQLFTPAYAAARHLRQHSLSAYVLVREAALADFAGVRLDEQHPDAVVVGDLADEWSYELLNRAFRFVHEQGARLIGLGRSLYWRASAGLLLDVGPFLAALECATGQQALVFGKPDRAIFDTVVDDLKMAAAQVVMVGDDLQVDVNPAQAAGLRGVLVRTGKFAESDLGKGRPPDLILDSVSDIVVV